MKRALPLLAAALPALAAAGVPPAYGGTVRVALPGSPQLRTAEELRADPLVARALCAPLLTVDPRGALVPGALDEVPVPEAEGRAFRLRLRPGLVDATGRPLGAPELARHLTALLSPDAPSPDAWVALPLLGADAVLEGRAPVVAGLQVLSATDLLVTLAFPLVDFPWLLATAPAALPDAGPFVVAGTGAEPAGIRLARNDHHYLGRPFADALELLQPPDARAAARLLERGGAELVLRPEPAGGRPGPVLAPLTVTVAVLNPARLGAGTEALRRALAALDRAELARRFVRGPAEPLATLVPPALLPGAPASAPPGPPVQAPPAHISLLADASAPDQRALAERIQVKLFDRRVRSVVELVDRARHQARLAAGDYDVALLSVRVLALRPSLAAGQLAFAARGPAAARRAMATLSGLAGDAALDAADRLGRELQLVPLVASGLRASLGPALQGLSPGADGAFDPGGLWLLRAGAAEKVP